MKKVIEYIKLHTETDTTKWTLIKKVSETNCKVSLEEIFLYTDKKYYIFGHKKINKIIMRLKKLKKQRNLYSNEIFLFNLRAADWRRTNLERPY